MFSAPKIISIQLGSQKQTSRKSSTIAQPTVKIIVSTEEEEEDSA